MSRSETEQVGLSALVASRIDAEMARRKLTRRHLAKRAGVSEGTIRRVLSGEDVLVGTLGQIAKALRIDVADLVATR